MDASWDILEQAGVPCGAVRPTAGPPLDAERLRSALSSVHVTAESREALLAWLDALRHHWPSRFDELAGAVGVHLAQSLAQAPLDANRYLKLRRIAIENLAARL